MKNIHILPTGKPNRVYLIKSNNKLGITSNNPEFTENFRSGTQNQNIYITNSEEIKDGDWVLGVINEVMQVTQKSLDIIKPLLVKPNWRKIILTTDQDLIKDGVQAIDDEFLEWFVKNPSCEEVETVFACRGFNGTIPNLIPIGEYKIIIQKEEVKQETTLEEVAHKMLDDYGIKSMGQSIGVLEVKKLMVKMAKWQQQGYSEEEVLKILTEALNTSILRNDIVSIPKWFNKFKKK